jgi:hypothetical protein
MIDKQLNDIYSQVLAQEPITPVIEPTQAEPVLSQSQPAATPAPSSETATNDVSVSAEPVATPTTLEDKPAEGQTWDSFIEAVKPVEAVQSTFDFSSLGNAIGVEVKSQDELVNHFKSLNEQLTQAKALSYKDDVSMPDEVKEVIEVAKSGGDYLAMLDVLSVDYSKEDPTVLFETEVAELFYNQDGSFREDEYNEYLDSLLPADKLMRGKSIQRELMQIQAQKRNEIKQKALHEKAVQIESVKRALDGMDKVNGFEVTPAIKGQMYNDFASGAVYAKLGILANGKIDAATALNAHFKAQYFDAIVKYLQSSARTEKTREVIKDLSNVNIAKAPQVENVTPTKSANPLDGYLASLVQTGVKR